MKKFLVYLVVLSLIVSTLVFSVSCIGPKEGEGPKPVSFEMGEKVDGLSAYEVAKTAILNWRNDTFKQYKREEFLDFSAGKVATRYERSVFIRDNDEMYGEKVAYNTGMAKDKYMNQRYYQQGNDAYYSTSKEGSAANDKSFKVSSWSAYNKLSNEEMESKYPDFKKHSTTYNIDKKEYILKGSDDTVYKAKDNDKYYVCTLKIDVSDEALNTHQAKAKQEFVNAIGCKENSLVIFEATINFIIEPYNDTYRIIKWQYFESYKGTVMVLTTSAQQTYTAEFKYDKDSYTIAQELKP